MALSYRRLASAPNMEVTTVAEAIQIPNSLSVIVAPLFVLGNTPRDHTIGAGLADKDRIPQHATVHDLDLPIGGNGSDDRITPGL